MGGCMVQNRVQLISREGPDIKIIDTSPIKINGKITSSSIITNSYINNIKISNNKRNTHTLGSGSTQQSTPMKFNNSFLNPPDELNDSKLDSKFKIVKIKKDVLLMNLYVNNNDIQCPIWVEKNQILKFEVKGKWSLSKSQGYCGPEGYLANISNSSNNKTKNLFRKFALGALLGRILGGTYFVIRNNLQIKSDYYGPLYLCTNTEDNCNDKEGLIGIKITGCIPIEHNYIEEKLGWDINQIDNLTNNIELLTNEEKLHINLINKLRINPELFAEIYLKNLISKGKLYNDLYIYVKSLKPLKPLIPNFTLIGLCKIQGEYLKKSGSTGSLSSTGEDLTKRLANFNVSITNFAESHTYGYIAALDNLLYLLLDEFNVKKVNRLNLMNSNYSSIGVSTNTHFIYQSSWINIYTDKIQESQEIQKVQDI